MTEPASQPRLTAHSTRLPRRGLAALAALAAVLPPLWIARHVLDTRDAPMAAADAPDFAARWRVVPLSPPQAGGAAGVAIEWRFGPAIAADACPTPRVRLATENPTAPAASLTATAPAADADPLSIDYEVRWRRSGDASVYEQRGVYEVPNVAGGAEGAEFALPDLPLHPAWKGDVEQLELRLAPQVGSVRVLAAGIPAAGWGERLAIAWRQWWHFERPSNATINSIRAPHPFGFAPVVLVVFALASCLLAILSIACWTGRPVRRGVIFALVGSAWLINDLRTLQLPPARPQAAGRRGIIVPEFGAAGMFAPPEIEALASMAQRTLPPGAVYSVVGGNIAAGDSRLRYLLAPHFVQVNVDPLQPQVHPDRAEYILMLRPDPNGLDTSTGAMRIPGQPACKVRRIAGDDHGPAVFQRVAP